MNATIITPALPSHNPNRTCFSAIQNGSPADLMSLLPAPTNGRIPGWVYTPNLRGTWDILCTCLATTFLCTHTILCLNVPAPGDGARSLMLRRLKWILLAILAPEIVLTFAAGQWSRARRSRDEFRASGYEQWNMRTAFFSDMGGFVLETADQVTFPLNAKQLHWLVINGHVGYPQVTEKEIWDKSKQDGTTKLITVFQIGYFVLHCIERAAQQLPITTLELSTLAIVVCSLMTAVTWMRKPSDVRTPVRLHTRSTVRDLTNGRPWANTPLDSVDANLPGWSMNVQPFMGFPTIPAERPIQRIPNDRFPTNPYSVQEYLLCLATLIFTAIHVVGWNFSFPSLTEQSLWRICSVALFGATALFWALETVASWFRLGRWKWLHLRLFKKAELPQFEKNLRMAAETTTRDFATLPQRWEFCTITPIGLLYGLARLYLIAEAFVELRDLEARAFLATNWEAFVPHI